MDHGTRSEKQAGFEEGMSEYVKNSGAESSDSET
jgi:hypothetical protein